MNTLEAGRRPWNQPKVPKPKPKGKRDKCKLYPPEPLYTALADLDFTWYADEINQVIEWWQEGVSVVDMAKQLVRDPDEVTVLLMDLARAGRITWRPSGPYGEEDGKDGAART